MSSPQNRITAWAALISLVVLVVIPGDGAELPASPGSSVLNSSYPSQITPTFPTDLGITTSSMASSDGTTAVLTNHTTNATLASFTLLFSPLELSSSWQVYPTDLMTALDFSTFKSPALTASLTVSPPNAPSSVSDSQVYSVNDTYSLNTSAGSDSFTGPFVLPTSDSNYTVSSSVVIQPTQVLSTSDPTSTAMNMSTSDLPYEVSTASIATGNSTQNKTVTTKASFHHVEENAHSSLSVGTKAAIGVCVSLAVCGVIFAAIVCSRRSNMTARSVKSLITSGIRYKTYKNKDDEGMLIMPDRR